MFMKELSCPYCGAKQNPHGFGQLEKLNERNCQACGKPFVFTVSVYYQTFIEVDFSEPQTDETSAVDTLKQMVADAPKEEVKAHISSEIMAAVAQHCRGYGKKQSLIERFAAKTGYSVSKITNMLSRACMMDESVADMLSIEIEKPFYIDGKQTRRGGTKEWRIAKQVQAESSHTETESATQSLSQLNTDGMTTFEYIFGYNTITETRKIDPADIPAYLEKLSAKKEHRDVITGKPKPWELLKINGVPVKKEDEA
jgi:hypothetical protein